MLFSHVGGPDGCRPAGVRRVKGITGTKNGSWRRGHQYSGGWAGAPPDELGAPVGYADADGYEIVDAYQCVENCPVRLLDEQAGPRTSGGRTSKAGSTRPGLRGNTIVRPSDQVVPPSDGNCSRYFPTFPGADPDPEDAVPYFYTPKASRSERNAGCDGLPEGFNDWQRASSGMNQDRPNREGRKPMGPAANHHPTVKPLALMRWLVRLITPSGGVVLDPFAGSGTTALACIAEGCHYIAIDAEERYCAIARARIAHAQQQRHGPLFANADAEKDA